VNQSPIGVPATMGRRVKARCIDVGVSMVLVVLVNVLALAALQSGGGSGLVLVLFALLGLWSLFSFWAMFARAALPGQLMLGLHHVDGTGRRAGGRTFAKYLLQAPTFGLALLITPLSIQAPNRSWFDRMAGVTLVDTAASDRSSSGPQVAAPPAGWQTDESELTQGGHAATDAPAGMIHSVPFEGAGPQVMRNTPPAVRREAGVVEPRPAAPIAPPPSAAPAAPVAVPAGPRPIAVLDSGETYEIAGPIVMGRAPRQSASLGQAQLVVVADQSISANHLALGVDDGAPWVMDLSSTNGSWVEQDGRGPVRLDGMRRTPVSPGAVVKLGHRTITVTAR
jgi:uncharacterized RDD family membrane protein YckC